MLSLLLGTMAKEFILNHYIGLGLQLVGFTMVGFCLFSGLTKGDYGKLELIQLVAGSAVFYVGHFFRKK